MGGDSEKDRDAGPQVPLTIGAAPYPEAGPWAVHVGEGQCVFDPLVGRRLN